MIEITRVQKANNGSLSKHIRLKDGEVKSSGSSCVMSAGTARRMRVTSIQAFADCIHSLERHEAITLGTLTTAVKKDEVNVITKYRLNGHAGPDIIARTSEYISYRPGQPALALIDIDSKGMPAAVRDLIDEKGGYWDSIVSVVPVLANVTRIERNSTSSCLSREDTGEKLPASDGRHIYVVVKDGADVERFLRVLHDRCWLSGLGWYVVSRSGQLLERSIVDRMVFAAERLVFEGPPYVEPPLTQDREARKPKVFNGEPADTATACRDLTAVEQANLDVLRRAARFRLKATAEKKKAAYINENAKVLAERAKISAEAARRIIEQQTGGNLLPHIELPFDDPEFKGHTVAQVLADPDRYVGETLADPLEGLDYGTGKAQVLRRADGSLCVHSFAHGRMVYELRHDATTIEAALHTAAKGDVPDILERLILQANLEPEREHDLLKLAAKLGEVLITSLKTRLKFAKAAQKRRQVSDRREQRAATRKDTRIELLAPESDAERTPVLRSLDEVLCAVQDPEPPMRDIQGWPVEIRCRAPLMLHELTACGSNDQEDQKSRLPAPALPLISSHNRYSMAHVIEKHIEFYAESETSGRRPVALPPVFVDHFLNWRDSAMPEVEGVMTAPLVLPDGTLLAPVGLDRDRKLVFRIEPALLKLLPKPDECTPEACGEALDFLINTWLVDVTTDFIGRCNLVAEAMTILERVLFPERPAWFITAGKRGGGKTTAQTMVVLAATGKKPPAAAWSPSLEERRKAMFAYLSEGLAALVWDNIPLGTVISCPVLESVLTTDHWTDRQLSVSKTPIVQAFTVMAFTGNNVGPSGDLASRVLKVDLVVDRVDPENRTFTHPDPIAWTLDHRGEILRALYTIMLGNKQLKAGPDAQQSTRFKAWWRLVGSAIENAAVAMMAAQTGQELDETVKRAEAIDYNDVFKTVEDTDEVAASVSDVLEALYTDMKSYGRTAFEAAHIAELVNGIETDEHVQALRQFIDPSGRKIGSITAKSVGWRLKTIVGTPVVVGDKVMTLKPMDAGSKRALLYQIVTSKKL